MTRSQFILPLLFAASLLPALEAQTPIETLSPTSSRASTGDWMQTAQFFDNWHGRLYVVTLDHPGHRFNCKLQSIGAASLTCASSGLHAAHTFAAEKIASISTPGHHAPVLFYFLGTLVLGAGLLAAAWIAPVSLLFTIPMGIAGTLTLLISPLTALASDDDNPGAILYQRPDTPLTVHPR